jgi:membrane fusion protein, multidrug efflux system
MKKAFLVVIVLAALAALAWLIWFKPAKPEEPEAAVETEVAVHLGQIIRTNLCSYVTAFGVVEPEPPGERPAASARVASPVAGVIAKVSCAEGQQVAKGMVLFQVDSRLANVAVEKTRQAAEFAAINLERQKKLMQVDGTSQKSLVDAEQTAASARSDLSAAQTQQALLSIEAPLAGTVTRIHVKPGEAVDLTTALVELVDLDRLVVSASVPSTELAGLKPGLPTEVLVDNAVMPLKGTLVFISPQVDVKTGTAPVRISLPAHTSLRPGQWTKIRIISEERRDRLAVPVESVVKDEHGNTVIALVQDHKAAQKPVKTGLRDGGLAEIEADGLQPGLKVVTEGAYGLPKETKIRILEVGGAETNQTEKPAPEK